MTFVQNEHLQPAGGAFHVKALPPSPPCAASQLDFAGWALGEGRRRCQKSPRHIQAQHLVSMTFQLRVLPSPRSSGQIAMDSWCHQRTMLKLRACASAVPEFERSQIASLSSFSAEVATAFAARFAGAAALLDFQD